MIPMNNWAEQAVKKLEEAEQKGVGGQKERAMLSAVAAQLKNFCQQDEEFAQAVVQGGTLGECLKKVAAGTGSSISDLDAYKKAVQFYFPGAEVHMELTIDLIGKAAKKKPAKPAPVAAQPAPAEDHPQPEEEKSNILRLNLADFFG